MSKRNTVRRLEKLHWVELVCGNAASHNCRWYWASQTDVRADTLRWKSADLDVPQALGD